MVSSAVHVIGRPTSALQVEHLVVGEHAAGQQGDHAPPGVADGLEEAARARRGRRRGTAPAGRRSPLWVGEALLANPMAPPAMASATTACIAASSSAVAARS